MKTNTNDWSALDAHLREINAIPMLADDETTTLGARACKGDRAAQERLVGAHLRLVVRIAHAYAGYGLPLADLVAEGNIALMRAAELYDPRFRTKFTSYATMWIKQRLHRALTNQAKAVRIPVWRSQRLRKLAHITDQLATELGRAPEPGELATHLGMTAEELAGVQGDRLDVVSLDEPVRPGDEDSARLRDTFVDENAPDPTAGIDQRENRELLMAGLHELSDHELDIVSRRHGLHPSGEATFRELARQFGVSHEWVRRITELALVKVRRGIEKLPALSARERTRRQSLVERRLRRLARAGLPSAGARVKLSSKREPNQSC